MSASNESDLLRLAREAKASGCFHGYSLRYVIDLIRVLTPAQRREIVTPKSRCSRCGRSA